MKKDPIAKLIQAQEDFTLAVVALSREPPEPSHRNNTEAARRRVRLARNALRAAYEEVLRFGEDPCR